MISLKKGIPLRIAVSTVAFIGKSVHEIIQVAKENNLTIEFSSGLKYMPDMEEIYLNAGIDRLPHNYFPAPKEPFVLNLASSNNEIRQRSIVHCIKGLELAKKTNAPFFAAHSGFCIDPKPEELGRVLEKSQNFSIKENERYFCDSLNILSEKAEELQVEFLIENNVLTKENIYFDGSNPLLCVSPKEILKIFGILKSRFLGLLLDTGHLKVSAHTLGFDLDNGLNEIAHLVRGIHHSDNNGQEDSNNSLASDYWFFKHLHRFSSCLHILEIKNLDIYNIKQHFELFKAS